MDNQLNLFELPAWRIIAIGRDRNKGETLRNLIDNVEDIFSIWFNTLPTMMSNSNDFSLSHGAIWNATTEEKLYVRDFHLFSLAHQKIVTLEDVLKSFPINSKFNDFDFVVKYIKGGLYYRKTSKDFSGIKQVVETTINSTLINNDFIWNGCSCIEVYREPYPKKDGDDLVQIFFPVKPNNNFSNRDILLCSYCGSYFNEEKNIKSKKCCCTNLRKIRIKEFGKISFMGGI